MGDLAARSPSSAPVIPPPGPDQLSAPPVGRPYTVNPSAAGTSPTYSLADPNAKSSTGGVLASMLSLLGNAQSVPYQSIPLKSLPLK